MAHREIAGRLIHDEPPDRRRRCQLAHEAGRKRQHVANRRVTRREAREADEREDVVRHAVRGDNHGSRRRAVRSGRPRNLPQRVVRRERCHVVDELAMHADECLDHQRLVHRAAARAQNLERLLVGQRGAIGTIGRQRVEAIDDRQDPRADRDVGAGDAAGIAAAVPVLVMTSHDRHDRIRKVDERQNVGADIDVPLHLLELGRRQFAGLVEDVLGYRQLARVVQKGRGLDAFQRRLVVDAERTRQPERVGLYAAHVVVRHVVFGVDCHGERLDRGKIQAIEMREMRAGIVEPAERRPQRQMQHDQKRKQNDDDAQARPGQSGGRGRTRPTRPRSNSPTATKSARARRRMASLRVSSPMATAIRPEFSRK